jgi:amylosucrase
MSAPAHAHDSAAASLDSARLSSDRRESFHLRLDRYWSDLSDGIGAVYADLEVAEQLTESLLALAASAYAERGDDLHRRDQERLLRPDWLQQPRMFGYACYTERFGGSLLGVTEHLDYLEDLGVTYLHLMPLLQPREGDSDGGYAVQDYRAVRSDLGTVDDLRDLATTLRSRGISLVVDLVLNHVAREHQWAVAARSGDPTHRDYFHVFPDRRLPDAYEQTLPEVFPEFAPGNFTYEPELDGWVWTTFNEWQWDLNWSNPAVLIEFVEIILWLANLGVEVLRLDAIAFVWKRMGSSCQNQPEVHAITQVIRAITRIVAPAVAMKAEAIVAPRDLVQYLGIGTHAGRVSDLAYHNSLMVQIWSMLASQSAVLGRQALTALPAAPSTGTWITYVRCHDDIGWAIDDSDAAAVGVTGDGHRSFLADWYGGDAPGSWSDGLIFQANPNTGDRRISGTAASLAGLHESSPAGAVDAALGRIFLAHAIAAAWGGVPVVWSGDELGQTNDPDWMDEEGHQGDNRWANRPRLDWTRAAQRHDLRTVSGRVFSGLAHIARVRSRLPQLHASAPSHILPGTDDGILATLRRHPSGLFVGLYNVTERPRPVPLDLIQALGLSRPYDALSGHELQVGADAVLWLPPYGAWWVVARPRHVCDLGMRRIAESERESWEV